MRSVWKCRTMEAVEKQKHRFPTAPTVLGNRRAIPTFPHGGGGSPALFPDQSPKPKAKSKSQNRMRYLVSKLPCGLGKCHPTRRSKVSTITPVAQSPVRQLTPLVDASANRLASALQIPDIDPPQARRSSSKYSRTGTRNLRQDSSTLKIAATFGSATGLPTWIRFLRPRAIPRIEFSARFVLSSISGYSRTRRNRTQSDSV